MRPTRRVVLKRARRGEAKLELPTIMDRGLAVKHGATYVHLAAFAIDVDRVFAALAPDDEDDIGLIDPAADELPFGWEIFLTSARLHALDPSQPAILAMLEETCSFVLDQAPDEQGYGSQLVFGVYDAVKRGALPQSLADLFRSWRGRPKQLERALELLWRDVATTLPAIAQRCTTVTLDPPLAPPTRSTLQQMAAGTWTLRINPRT
jgi:hypothetical protein